MGNRALFLDRDGVINEDRGYIYQSKDVKFVDGIFDLCRQAQAAKYKIIIVTNQAGIGRGMYSEEDFHALMRWMCGEFEKHRVAITETYFCPHHPEHGVGEYKKDCEDRKPKPGMFLKARAAHDLSMGGSIMVGDKEIDMKAAKDAGIPTRLLFGGEPSVSATRTITALRHVAMEF